MRFRPTPALLTLMIAAACSGEKSAPPSNSSTGGTLIIATLGEPSDVLPPYVGDEDGRRVEDIVFDRLADIDSTLATKGDKAFSPRLAKKWTWASDSLSIAFSIDPTARWHDGQPVTANDVRFTFNTFVDPKVGSPNASVISNIDSVSVRDSLTAVVFFKKRTPEQFYDVAYQLYIFPEHVYGRIPLEQLRTDPKSRAPIGSGRFRFVSWQPGRVELLSDTANYRGRAKVDRLILVKTDAPAAVAQVLSGEADVMPAFPVDQIPMLDSNRFARAVFIPQLGYAFMGFNRFAPKSTTVPNPLFSDLRMRRALSMAVDRVAMVHNVFGPQATNVSHGPFSMTASYADADITPPAYDTAKAGAILDSLGWRRGPDGMRAKNGKPLHFTLTVGGSSYRRKFAVLLQNEFKKAGVDVELDQLDNNAWSDKRTKGNYDAIIDGFNPDPSVAGMRQSWATAGFPPVGQNSLRYSNKLVDALIDSATATFDNAKSKAYSSRAFRQILDEAPAIWLYDIAYMNGVNRRINVPTLRADGWWISLPDWTVDPAKRIDRDRIGLAPAKK
jgi:peptide/nickel transport system substrate-binding protein